MTCCAHTHSVITCSCYIELCNYLVVYVNHRNAKCIIYDANTMISPTYNMMLYLTSNISFWHCMRTRSNCESSLGLDVFGFARQQSYTHTYSYARYVPNVVHNSNTSSPIPPRSRCRYLYVISVSHTHLYNILLSYNYNNNICTTLYIHTTSGAAERRCISKLARFDYATHKRCSVICIIRQGVYVHVYKVYYCIRR